MSWIIQDLWATLESRQNEYASLLETDRIRAFEAINKIAFEVGQRHQVLLQLNFPPGQYGPSLNHLGHTNLSIIVHRGRDKFENVSETEVKKAFKQLSPQDFEPMKHSQEGFKARLSNGRIDCLPGAIHLWCEITTEVLGVLDWLFTRTYLLTPD